MEAKFFLDHLRNDLIPFWSKMRDDENGGFYGYADALGKPNPESSKGVILTARIMWFYSAAYQLLRERPLLEMAEHAFAFLKERCYDRENGGVFWSVNAREGAFDDTKHTYCQAFVVYALAKFYNAGGSAEALDLAYGIYGTIEGKCRDDGGYLEAFNRDFSPCSNEKLSENGVMASRTMNTLLHVIEAYTELYIADNNTDIGGKLKDALRLFKDKIYDPEMRICKVFFDHDYNSLIDLESYGHNIEASWLLERACGALGDDPVCPEIRTISKELAAAALENGFDRSQGALNNEREFDKVNRTKVWWVQAESVIGFYNFYSNYDCAEFLEASEKVLNFIRENVIDKSTGEWIENIAADGNTDRTQALVHEWKCPYHNGRMCVEMISRLSKEA